MPNKIHTLIEGCLGRDPFISTGKDSGKEYARLSVAVRYGKDMKNTFWAEIMVFGWQAVGQCKNMKKGSHVLCECENPPTINEWTAKDGMKRQNIQYVSFKILPLAWVQLLKPKNDEHQDLPLSERPPELLNPKELAGDRDPIEADSHLPF